MDEYAFPKVYTLPSSLIILFKYLCPLPVKTVDNAPFSYSNNSSFLQPEF